LSLFNELKRRNVFKVGIGYVLIAWLVAQVLQLVFESFGTPPNQFAAILLPVAATTYNGYLVNLRVAY
jgi:hypothetical protein